MTQHTEELINKVGGFGWFQRRLFAILSFQYFVSTLALMVMTFSTAEPPWRCTSNSTSCTLQGTFNPKHKHYKHRCDIPRDDWEFAVEGDFDSIVTEWDLVCDTALYVTIVNSLLFLLWIAGNLVGSILSDKFGRKKVSLPFFLFLTLVAFLSAFARRYWVFALFRSLLGFGMGGFGSTAFVLIIEYTGARQRSAVGFGIWSSWILAMFVLSLLGYLIPSWRTLTIASCVPGFFAIVFWWFTPESLRWLLLKGKTDEVKQTFKDAARINGKTLTDDEVMLLDDPNDKQDDNQRMGDVRDLFASKKITYQTLASWYSWFASGMVYYGISLSTPAIGGNMYLNFSISGVCEAVGMFIGVVCLNKFGRRKTIAASLWIAGVALVAAALLTYYDDGGKGYLAGKILMAMMMGKFFITIAFDGVFVHTSELFPTVVRNTAIGTASSAARIGSALSAYIVFTDRFHPLMPFTIMAVNALVSGIVFITLPETLNQAMPDTVRHVETTISQDNGVDINHHGDTVDHHGDTEDEKKGLTMKCFYETTA